MLKKIILILLCAVMLVGCTEDTSEDIQPTGTTRNPKEEAELRRILDAAVAEGITQPTTTSRSEAQAIENYENNRSELIKLNPIIENLAVDSVLSISEDLILFDKNGKYGFINKYGEEIIAPAYVDARQFKEGLSAVRNNRNKWGYIDKEGTLVIPFQFDRADVFSGGFAPAGIFDGRKMGYINTSGEIVIPLIYDETYVFNDDGYAVVKQGDKYGAIDEDNNIIIPLEYNALIIHNEVVLFKDENEKCGLMNMRGEIIVPAIYEDISWSRDDNGIFFVLQDGKVALINKSGEFITDFIFDSYTSFFNEGLALVFIRNVGLFTNGTVISGLNEWAYIDETGEIVIRLGSGVIGDNFNNGVAVIYNIVNNAVGAYGLIDKAGKLVLPCVYKQIVNLGEGLIAVQRYEDGTWDIYETEEIK